MLIIAPFNPSRQPIASGLLYVCFFLLLMTAACGGGGGDGGPAPLPNTQSFTLTGTVTPPSNAAVDWDVKDANTTTATSSNNALTSTQPLSNPVSVAGNLSLDSDVSDFFSVAMSEGQTVALYVAEADNADIDLFIYNDLGQLQNSAMGQSAFESLEITADGNYIVELRVVSLGQEGAVDTQTSNYNLIIGAELAAGESLSGMRLSDDFVSGDVLVRFKQASFGIQVQDADQQRRRVQALGLTLADGDAGGVMRMWFDSQSESPAVLNSLGMARRALNKAADIEDPERRGKQRTLEVIKALRQREDVLFAEPNYIRKAFATPNDTYYNLQWHYNQINLPSAWDVTTGSTNVIVAVVDTGVLVNHPDLSGKLTGTGYDFIQNAASAGDGNGIDSNPDDPGDKANADGSSSFHGTHVAGTVAAATGNNAGVSGAGWATRVMAVRALGLNGSGTDYDIAQGVRYAAGLSNDSGTVPPIPADIINLSLGGAANSSTLSVAVQAALAQDVIVIAAAGNESTSQPSYPAAYVGVVSVSAVAYATNLAYYSNFGSTIDVAAPGGDASTDLNGDGYGDGVLSTLGSDGSGSIDMVYGFYQGTSMAAPHMAAVAALMKALRPAMTPGDLDAFLASGDITTNIGSANNFGNGLIDAQKAVVVAQTGAVPTLIGVNPTLISLGITLSGATITIEKIGDTNGNISVTSTTADESWLTVAPDAVDANGIGTYTVTGTRGGLEDGAYNGSVSFVSSQNTVKVSVSMQVGTPASSVNAGYHYVVLTNTDTGQAAYVSGAQAQNGVYNFMFLNVVSGTYQLSAGTDLDNDSRIGDPGEIIGAYLSLDQPQEITVDSNMSGLDFISEFNTQIGGAITTGQHRNEQLYRLPDKRLDRR